MANIYKGTLGLIGNTPLVEVTNIEKELGLEAKLLVKLEYFNPAGSVKDRVAKAMIEDKEQIPSRAYRPTVVLVSDGRPNDQWKGPLDVFMSEGRSAKCYRMALGIGVERGSEAYDVLKRFTSDVEQVFDASDAAEIGKFFQYVTMSTTARIKTANPNHVPSMEEVFAEPEIDRDEADDDFPF